MSFLQFFTKFIKQKDDDWRVSIKYDAYLKFIQSTSNFKLTDDKSWYTMMKKENCYDSNYFIKTEKFLLISRGKSRIQDRIIFLEDVFEMKKEGIMHPELSKFISSSNMNGRLISESIMRYVLTDEFFLKLKEELEILKALYDNYNRDYVIEHFGVKENLYKKFHEELHSEKFNTLSPKSIWEFLFISTVNDEEKRALLALFEKEIYNPEAIEKLAIPSKEIIEVVVDGVSFIPLSLEQ